MPFCTPQYLHKLIIFRKKNGFTTAALMAINISRIQPDMRCKVFCFGKVMAFFSSSILSLVSPFFLFMFGIASAQLSSNFYSSSCPTALSIIQGAVSTAVSKENRMGASLLRLHFHDCFVNASLILFLFLIPIF